MHFSVPEKKLNKLKSLLTSAISDGYCSARFLAKIAGSIISCALAVGPISRLLTRQMYFAIETRVSWESTTHFTPACWKNSVFGTQTLIVLTAIAYNHLLHRVPFCFRMLAN